MIKVNRNLINLLQKHGFTEEDILDATGMRAKDWKLSLAESGRRFAIGVTPCKAAGHRIRNKSGNCVQCGPRSLIHASEYNQPGLVYVAWSKSLRAVKVGIINTTRRTETRERELNRIGYGGVNDWEIFFQVHSVERGRKENSFRSHFQRSKVEIKYEKNGKLQFAKEIYRITKQDAKKFLCT